MVSNQIFMLVGITLASVRNLIFDYIMLNKCVALCSVSIAKIWNILSQSDAKKLIHAFISSRLDWAWNSLLSRSPKTSRSHVSFHVSPFCVVRSCMFSPARHVSLSLTHGLSVIVCHVTRVSLAPLCLVSTFVSLCVPLSRSLIPFVS